MKKQKPRLRPQLNRDRKSPRSKLVAEQRKHDRLKSSRATRSPSGLQPFQQSALNRFTEMVEVAQAVTPFNPFAKK
jgi:hypothetical protein